MRNYFMLTHTAEANSETILPRLDKLERENRWLKAGLGGLLLLTLLGGWFMKKLAAKDELLSKDEIETKEIVVSQRSDGCNGIVLKTLQDYSVNFVVGNGSTSEADLSSGKDGVAFSLSDLKSNERQWGTALRQLSGKPSKEYETNPSAVLFVRNDGSRALRFYDDNAVCRTALSLTKDGSRLDFLDATGKGRLALGVGKDGEPFLAFWDAYGKPIGQQR
jgi:hypothetical protein